MTRLKIDLPGRVYELHKETINKKECLIFFNGYDFEEMTSEFIEELIRLSKNSLKEIESVNMFVNLKNIR